MAVNPGCEIIRFINDILLSAPSSIVVGLFVYTIVVVQMQHLRLGRVIALALLRTERSPPKIH